MPSEMGRQRIAETKWANLGARQRCATASGLWFRATMRALLVLVACAGAYVLMGSWPRRPTDACYAMVPSYLAVLGVHYVSRRWSASLATFGVMWLLGVYTLLTPPYTIDDWPWFSVLTAVGALQVYLLDRMGRTPGGLARFRLPFREAQPGKGGPHSRTWLLRAAPGPD